MLVLYFFSLAGTQSRMNISLVERRKSSKFPSISFSSRDTGQMYYPSASTGSRAYSALISQKVSPFQSTRLYPCSQRVLSKHSLLGSDHPTWLLGQCFTRLTLVAPQVAASHHHAPTDHGGSLTFLRWPHFEKFLPAV